MSTPARCSAIERRNYFKSTALCISFNYFPYNFRFCRAHFHAFLSVPVVCLDTFSLDLQNKIAIIYKYQRLHFFQLFVSDSSKKGPQQILQLKLIELCTLFQENSLELYDFIICIKLGCYW